MSRFMARLGEVTSKNKFIWRVTIALAMIVGFPLLVGVLIIQALIEFGRALGEDFHEDFVPIYRLLWKCFKTGERESV